MWINEPLNQALVASVKKGIKKNVMAFAAWSHLKGNGGQPGEVDGVSAIKRVKLPEDNVGSGRVACCVIKRAEVQSWCHPPLREQ